MQFKDFIIRKKLDPMCFDEFLAMYNRQKGENRQIYLVLLLWLWFVTPVLTSMSLSIQLCITQITKWVIFALQLIIFEVENWLLILETSRN